MTSNCAICNGRRVITRANAHTSEVYPCPSCGSEESEMTTQNGPRLMCAGCGEQEVGILSPLCPACAAALSTNPTPPPAAATLSHLSIDDLLFQITSLTGEVMLAEKDKRRYALMEQCRRCVEEVKRRLSARPEPGMDTVMISRKVMQRLIDAAHVAVSVQDIAAKRQRWREAIHDAEDAVYASAAATGEPGA